MKKNLIRAIATQLQNTFCPTGEGGGVDPTCGKGETGAGDGRTFASYQGRSLEIDSHRGGSLVSGSSLKRALDEAGISGISEGNSVVASVGLKRVGRALLEKGWKAEYHQVKDGNDVISLRKGDYVATVTQEGPLRAAVMVSKKSDKGA
jgi:hypothetical protein